LHGVVLSLLNAFEDVLVTPFVPDGAVVALDVGVLLGMPRLDMQDGNSLLFSPFHQLFANVFRAVVDTYGVGLAPTLDDPIQAWYHPFGWQREVDLDPQPFAVYVIRDVQQPKCTPIAEALSPEIY
jgi:hypothetical protein